MCIRTALEMRLYEMLEAEGGKQKSAKELAQMLSKRLETEAQQEFKNGSPKVASLTTERHDLIGEMTPS